MATITKRGRRWLVQVRRKGIPAVSRTFDTMADAKAWAALEEAQIEKGLPPSPRRLLAQTTYGEVIRRYRDQITPHKKSADTDAQRLRQLENSCLAAMSLIDLTAIRLASYRDERLRSVKPATVRRELALISHSLEVAKKEWGFALPVNPVREIRLPTVRNARDRRLMTGEWQALLRAASGCRNLRIVPFIRLAVETGMRRSELVNLQWGDVNLSAATIFIRDSKSGYPRVIPVTDTAASILASLGHREGSVFSLTTNAFKLSWNRIIKKAGLVDLHFHDLRHEAISRFAEMGLSTVELAAISGHRDLRMLTRYTHIQPSALAKKLAGRSWEKEVGTL